VLPSLRRAKSPSRTSSVKRIGNASEDNGLLPGVFTAAAKAQPNNVEDTIENFHQEQINRMFPSLTGSSKANSTQSSSSNQNQDTNIRILTQGEDVLTAEKAEMTLLRYRSISPVYFPFVVIPNDWTLQYMMRENPMLLLAILTTMCNSTHLQKKLDSGFRKVLSQRVIVHGEKSLDILQGLLVYLAWNPFHLKPMSRQLHQFVQMATTMTMDLKFHAMPVEIERKIEEKRAYLGCFYLASAYVIFHRLKEEGFANPYDRFMIPPTRKNPLEFGTYAETVLLDIYTDPQYSSDYNLVKIVRLQVVIEGCQKQSAEDQQRMPGTFLEDDPLNECISSWLRQIDEALNQNPTTSSGNILFPISVARANRQRTFEPHTFFCSNSSIR
jgi:hypothetical protein